MKLDRNTNNDRRGKYALVNMRKLGDIIDKTSGRLCVEHDCLQAFELLVAYGFITLGNESPGDQFFVMKYKDIFTHEGLQGYANAVARAVRLKSQVPGLSEYALEMQREAAAARELGTRIPD